SFFLFSCKKLPGPGQERGGTTGSSPPFCAVGLTASNDIRKSCVPLRDSRCGVGKLGMDAVQGLECVLLQAHRVRCYVLLELIEAGGPDNVAGGKGPVGDKGQGQ